MFDVPSRTILLVKHGSHAYGLATPESDLDLKGVCIEPIEYHFGYLYHFDQSEKHANRGHPHDEVVYSLKKFVKLAADCNPNIIEVLFASPEDHVKIDAFGERLVDFRDNFISKKAKHTFSGYAHAQLKRIKKHRAWLLNPPAKEPIRADYGLPDRTVIPGDQLVAASSMIDKKLEKMNFEDMSEFSPDQRIVIQSKMSALITDIVGDNYNLVVGKSLGFDDNFLEILDRERRYKSARNHWDSFKSWEKNRNPIRAEQERKFGYDTKHASHLIRLLRMCKEILSGQGVVVKRPDREELLAIKLQGAVKYDDILAQADSLELECNTLYLESSLKKAPDRAAIDKFLVELTEDYLNRK